MIACKTKKWGNSIGVIIPMDVVREKGILPGEMVDVDIGKRGNVLEELAGSLKFDKPTRELLRESRKQLESKY